MTMCDTVVVVADATKGQVTIFAKNSDREPNEAQQLLSLTAARHQTGDSLACTYVSIPQAERTHAVLLAKPFWMWGAEMGVNEHGVAIGNEAVFTLAEQRTEPGLTGMDLVRLGLERGRDATAAIEVIITLLERHGQGGNCGYTRDFRYDNSFLIADSERAWVLETAGKYWVAKRVEGNYAISNGLTIASDWDRASPDIDGHAGGEAGHDGAEQVDFAASFTDEDRTSTTSCASRRARLAAVGEKPGVVTVRDAMQALRDHGTGPLWRGIPSAPSRKTVCMHSSGIGNAISQTTGSLVVALHPEGPLCFATGTSAPCTSVFKPVWPDLPVPGQDSLAGNRFDAGTLFWKHELLHRKLILADAMASASYRPELDDMELRFVTEAVRLRTADAQARAAFSRHCFAAADEATTQWYQSAVANSTTPEPVQDPYRDWWRNLNRAAGLPDGYAH